MRPPYNPAPRIAPVRPPAGLVPKSTLATQPHRADQLIFWAAEEHRSYTRPEIAAGYSPKKDPDVLSEVGLHRTTTPFSFAAALAPVFSPPPVDATPV